MSQLLFINIGTPELIILFLFTFVWLAVVILIFRFALSIPKFLKLQRQQTELLKEIAKANNVSPDKISGIENTHE